jgi:hypothetical protein
LHSHVKIVLKYREALNPDYPLARHSGACRKPVIKNARQSGRNHDAAPHPWEFFNHLDTGLRRYDVVFANGLFG